MTLQRGPNDPALIATYTTEQLVAEARRIAHNTRVMRCGEYTAGLIEALVAKVERGRE